MKIPFYILLCMTALSFSSLWAGDHKGPTFNKLKTIRLPKVEFWEVTFREAIDILHIQARLHDAEGDSGYKGINFVLRGNIQNERPITLNLTNVRLGSALHELCKISGNSMEISEFCVTFMRAQE